MHHVCSINNRLWMLIFMHIKIDSLFIIFNYELHIYTLDMLSLDFPNHGSKTDTVEIFSMLCILVRIVPVLLLV